jgi:hypothetical protein
MDAKFDWRREENPKAPIFGVTFFGLVPDFFWSFQNS